MVNVNKDELAGQHRYLRYVYFILSSFRLKSFRAWQDDGEPNPFVRNDLRPRQTHHAEIRDIFQEKLKG